MESTVASFEGPALQECSAQGATAREPDPETASPLSQSGTVWYPDGNVILRAGNILFRIYRGILAAKSSFFKDMFSLPQPDDAELHDGCPVLRVADEPTDMERFLRTLHDYAYFNHAAKEDMSVMISCLRIATKYDVSDLRQRIIHEFELLCPSTMKENDDWDERITVMPCFDGRRIVVVNTIREYDLPARLLPIALYNCCVHPIQGILDGYDLPAFGRVQLGAADLRLVLVVRDKLWMSERKEVLAFLRNGQGAEECEDDAACEVRRHTWLSELMELEDTEGYEYPNPLTGGWLHFDDHELCQACQTAGEEKYNEARQTLWDKLPGYFGLPDWSELCKVDDESGEQAQ